MGQMKQNLKSATIKIEDEREHQIELKKEIESLSNKTKAYYAYYKEYVRIYCHFKKSLRVSNVFQIYCHYFS